MKHLLLFLSFLVLYGCTTAQVTDTLTKNQFRELTFAEMKVRFKSNREALRAIRSYRTCRTLGRIFVPWGVLIAASNPVGLLIGAGLICEGVGLHLFHTKGRLYTKLVETEELTYRKKWRDSERIQQPAFDLSFEKFRKLNRREMRDKYMYDMTTKYILDYSFEVMNIRSFGKTMIYFIPAGIAAIVYSMTLKDPDARFGRALGGLELLLMGSAGIPVYIYAAKHSSKRILYQRLLTYYQNGTIDKDLQQYIFSRQK